VIYFIHCIGLMLPTNRRRTFIGEDPKCLRIRSKKTSPRTIFGIEIRAKRERVDVGGCHVPGVHKDRCEERVIAVPGIADHVSRILSLRDRGYEGLTHHGKARQFFAGKWN